MLLLTLLLAMGGAFIYLKVATPLYTSTIKFTVREMGTLALSSSQGGNQPITSTTFVSSQMEQIKGDTVLLRAASNLKQKFDAKELRDVVDTDMDRTTENVSITAKSPSAETAVTVVDAVFEAYKQTRAQLASDPNSPEKQLEKQYQDQKTKVEADLAKEEATRRDLQAKYGPDVGIEDHNGLEFRRTEYLIQAERRAKSEMEIAREDAVNAEKQLAKSGATRPVDPLEDDMDIGAGSVEELASLRAQILQLQAHLQGLEQKYLPEHPTIVADRKQALRLNRRYQLAVVQRARRAEREYNSVLADLQQSQIAMSKSRAGAGEYLATKGEVDRLRDLRNKLDGSIREIQFSGIEVKRFDGPNRPDKPSLPAVPKVLAIAVALGMVMGMVFAAAREWLDDRMRSAGEIRTSLGMPLLAVIPQSTTKRSFSVGGQRVLLDPASDAAEAYRSLRTAIQFSAPEGLKTLMIASPNSGDGKTTLTTNLGIAMAQAGKRVCIVDADLRKPTVHDIFSIKTTLGLSTLLAGRSTLDGTVQRTNVSGLDVLPCGPVPANPAEVLNSREFTEAIEELADRYDIVLLDSPPVQSAQDARVIAASCDATLIVLTARSAHRRTTEQTRDALQGVGARIIGLVVNDVPGRDGGSYSPSRGMRTLVPGLTSQEHEIMQVRK